MRIPNLCVILLGIIFFFGVTTLSTSYAQEKKSVDITGKKVEKIRGGNPNIKFSVPKTDDNPETKPETTRDLYCGIDFENRTGHYVDQYVDGEYKGTLGPWAKGTVTIYSGYNSIYCITSGETIEWYSKGSCDFYFTYNLCTP